MTPLPGRILVVRHGETGWSREYRHTGRTDVPLTEAGQDSARGLAPMAGEWHPAVTLCSPLVRARDTALLAGLTPEIDPDLLEWDYGAFEGRTTAEIRADTGDPDWSVWTTSEGLGESLEEVGERVARVLARCLPVLHSGRDIVLVSHAHLLRVLTARWLGLPSGGGAAFVLETAGTGVLGYERETPVLLAWNA